MPTSHSALEFMRRHGLEPTPRQHQLPRFNIGQLRLQSAPLEPQQLNPGKMLDALGDPPPDRGRTDPWPPPQEVV